MRKLGLGAALCWLTACAGAGEAPAGLSMAQPAVSPADLPSFFDCLREKGATIVSAHRGGPAPGYPENALETLQRTAGLAPVALEIDINRTKDGVLVLLHDDTLDRTTTGTGRISDLTFAELANVRLEDASGMATPYGVPTLAEALDWARGRALLQLDVKRGVPFEDVVAAVRKAGAQENALVITYNARDAARVNALDPGLYLSASARSAADLAALREAGVSLVSVGGWTGTNNPDPAVFTELARQGVESKFGTLGRPGQRLDDVYAAEGGAGWVRLAEAGVQLIASDRPLEAFAALDAADGVGVKWAGCLTA